MIVVSADLVAAYTDAIGIGAIGPSGEEVLITMPSSPEASIRGTNSMIPFTTPNTLTLNVHCQSFGVVSQTLAHGGPTPGLSCTGC